MFNKNKTNTQTLKQKLLQQNKQDLYEKLTRVHSPIDVDVFDEVYDDLMFTHQNHSDVWKELSTIVFMKKYGIILDGIRQKLNKE